MAEGARARPFVVVGDEDTRRCRVATQPVAEEDSDEVVARSQTESVGWLVAAALSVALYREEPWIAPARWSDLEFRVRDISDSGVELQGIGVHAMADAMEVVVALTREPETLLALLRGAPAEVRARVLEGLGEFAEEAS